MNEIRIMIEGLNELTGAIRELAGRMPVQGGAPSAPVSSQAVNAPTNTVPVQAPQMPPAAPLQQNMPLQQSVPVQQNMPAQNVPLQQGMPPQQVPTTAVAQEYTIEQLQVAAAGLTSSGKMPQVMGILQSFGIQAMTELQKTQYGAFAAALREAGAQI